MEKEILVVIDGQPTYKLGLKNQMRIGDLKDMFKEYSNYSIKFYINSKTELKVFSSQKYDNMDMDSIWEQIEDGTIYLEKKTTTTTTQCVKVEYLRKKYGKNMDFKTWLKDSKNLYVGRHGRIFINGEIFHYPESKWANPFKVGKGEGKYSLEESLKLYKEYLEKNGLLNPESLQELKDKTLGCFCVTASTTGPEKIDCHSKLLLSFL